MRFPFLYIPVEPTSNTAVRSLGPKVQAVEYSLVVTLNRRSIDKPQLGSGRLRFLSSQQLDIMNSPAFGKTAWLPWHPPWFDRARYVVKCDVMGLLGQRPWHNTGNTGGHSHAAMGPWQQGTGHV